VLLALLKHKFKTGYFKLMNFQQHFAYFFKVSRL